MKKIVSLGVLITGLLLSVLPVFADNYADDSEMRAYYNEKMTKRDYTVEKAVIQKIVFDDTKEVRKDVPLEADIRYQHLQIQILTGKYQGKRMTIRHTIERIMPGNYVFREGEKIILRVTEEDGKISTVKIEEKARDTQLFIIIGLFCVLMGVFAGVKGLKALLTLVITLGLILFAYIPLIIHHRDPVLSSVGISIVSVVITLFILSGRNRKTYAAIVGTSAGVIIAGILAYVFGEFTLLTGLSDGDAISLAYIPEFRNLDYKGLLFGTMLIGAVGAVMDVAVSIASALWEIQEKTENISRKEMLVSGMTIGKDILGSMANTLILAYVGTTLHLIILFVVYNVYIREIINLDSIATEIVRAMAGSIGLIATIPVTVFISTWIYGKKEKTR